MCFLRHLALALLLLSTGLQAETDGERLNDVRDEIKQISDDLSGKQSDRDALYAALQEQSLKVSDLNRELRALERQIAHKNTALHQLQTEAGIQEVQQQQQLDALYTQLRAAFMHAEPSYLEMLLNQHDIATISRGSTFFRYFHRSRQEQLEAIRITLNELNQEQRDILLAQQSLERAREQQLAKQLLLKEESEKRKLTLAALDKTISGQNAKLAALKDEEQNLQSLLDRLAKERDQQLTKETLVQPAVKPQQSSTAAEHPAVKTRAPFSRLTGKLNWPVSGKLLARYGTARNLGKLTWQGIVIDSPTGNDVKATAAGRVVFADWLRGFGLLVIIDHGEQYMTLYGNNDTLLKQAGQTVEQGEVIAQSGEQGIRGLTGLYFEIRHRGNPTNPMKWLSNRS